MSDDGSKKLAVLTLGRYRSSILEILLGLEEVDLNLICPSFLDYYYFRDGNRKPIIIRDELKHILMLLSKDVNSEFPVSMKVKNSYKESLNEFASEEELGVIYNINSMRENTNTILEEYDGLVQQIEDKDTIVLPLGKSAYDLYLYRGKKWAPVRYYLKKKSLDYDENEKNDFKNKKRVKELTLDGLEALTEDVLSEEALKGVENANILITVVSDFITPALLLEANEIIKSIKNSLGDTPSVLIWNPVPANEQETELLSMLGYEDTLKSFSDKLGSLVDYVILDETVEAEEKSVLRDFGLKILEEDLKGIDSKSPESIKNFVDTISNIMKTSLKIDESFIISGEEEIAIPASKLLESEAEKGLDKVVAVDTDEEETPAIIEDQALDVSDVQPDKTNNESVESQTPAGQNESGVPADPLVEDSETVSEVVPEKKKVYDPGMNETWEDALKGAIDDAIINNNQDAIDWIKYTCGKDDTLQVTMAEDVIKTLFESDMALRNNVINLIKHLYETNSEAFNQIYSKMLLNSISEKAMERRREIVQMYVTLQSDLMEFCEKLLNSVIKDLTQKREDDLLGMELSKLTLIQMVIGSRRLKKRAIRVILTLLDLRPDSNYLWNFLLPFDAGSVALELITQFSITKSEEIIRKSIILRYTDTYLTTIQSVINYWKEGDRNSIVNITGLILPDDTIRKLERMELAQQIKKLKLVPLTTLAELVDKDSKQIEVMVSELSLKDGLNIQMKVIDDRMVVTYEENENPE